MSGPALGMTRPHQALYLIMQFVCVFSPWGRVVATAPFLTAWGLKTPQNSSFTSLFRANKCFTRSYSANVRIGKSVLPMIFNTRLKTMTNAQQWYLHVVRISCYYHFQQMFEMSFAGKYNFSAVSLSIFSAFGTPADIARIRSSLPA